MNRTRALCLSMILVSATLLGPTAARAAGSEADALSESSGLVELEFRADRRVSTTVTRDGETIGTCVGDCVVRVPRGEYRALFDGDGVSSRSVTVVAAGRTHISVSAGDSDLRYGGLTVALVGTAAGLGGLGTAFLASAGCSGGCATPPDSSSLMILAGVGAVAAVTGWILFAAGGTDVRVEARRSGAETPVAFGIVPTRGGAFGTVGFAF